MRMRAPLAWLAASAVGIAACGGDDGSPIGASAAAAKARIEVATTVAPITSIVAQVAGDRVKITGVVPEGTDSHTFEPKPSAAELLAGVDVLSVNGLQLEEPTEELAKENLRAGAEIVELGTQSIPEREYAYDVSFPRAGGKPNPHLCGPPRSTRARTRRSCATTCPAATRATRATTRPTPRSSPR